MSKQTLTDTFLENLSFLFDLWGDSTYTLARRAKMPQRTVQNIKEGNQKVSIEQADAIGRAYGLTGWHLLMRKLPRDLDRSKSLQTLIDAYLSASEDGRNLIEMVASREAAKPDAGPGNGDDKPHSPAAKRTTHK